MLPHITADYEHKDPISGETVSSVSNVECIGVEKRLRPQKHFVYVLLVSWRDGVKHPVYRSYTTFFDLRACLNEEFKERLDVSIPELPSLKQFEGHWLFGHAREASIAEKRKKDIDIFCQKIVQLPDDVVSSNTITSFFEAWFSDFAQPGSGTLPKSPKPLRKGSEPISGGITRQREKAQRRISQPTELITNSLYEEYKDLKEAQQELAGQRNRRPRSSSLDMTSDRSDLYDHMDNLHMNDTSSLPRDLRLRQVEEESEVEESELKAYRACAAYEKRRSGEVTLHVGDIVEVLEKSISGWWFVHIEKTSDQGWAPGAFLEPVTEHTQPDLKEIDAIYEEIYNDIDSGSHYRTITEYKAKFSDEVTYVQGQEVELLEPSLDGWWKVRCNGQVGLSPAMHLEKTSKQGDTKKKKGSTLFKRKSTHRRGPPPRRNSARSEEKSGKPSMEEPMPVYAQVNKQKATDEAQHRANKDPRNITYTEISFTDDDIMPGKAQPKVQPKVEYSQININTKASGGKNVGPPPLPVSGRSPPEQMQPLSGRSPPGQRPPVSGRSPPQHKSSTSGAGRMPPLQISAQKGNGHTYENVSPNICIQYENVDVTDPESRPSMPQSDASDSRRLSHQHKPSRSPPHVPPPRILPPRGSPVPARGAIPPPLSPISRSPASIHPPQDSRLPTPRSPPPRSPTAIRQDQHLGGVGKKAPPVGERPPAALPHESSHINCPKAAPRPAKDHQPLRTRQAVIKRKTSGDDILSGKNTLTPSSSFDEPEVDHAVLDGGHDSIQEEPWYYGKMSRQTCETLLIKQGGQRDFFIRESTNRVGDFTLSVRYEDRVRHFPIEIKDNHTYFIGKHNFKNLSSVVQYYQCHPLFYDDNKQPVSLGEPLQYTKS